MPRRSLALTALIVAAAIAAVGYWEWSQTKACRAGASASKCHAGARVHPNRAYGLWVLAGIVVVVAGGLALGDRRD